MTQQVMSLDEIKARVGTELGVSGWLTIDQDRIDRFADCTNDCQWIHVDQKAAANGPFGAPIAHGYLTMSLIPHLSEQFAPILEGATMAVNYGMNKMRLLNPVVVGSRIRDRINMFSVDEKSNGRILVATAHTIEVEGQENPALYAEVLAMFFTG